MNLISNKENVDDIISDIEKWMEEANRKEHPDYANTVYCDKHLGVKMVLATSWGTIEYGDTSVDANTILLWACPKPDCDRYYDPTMFGYHSSRLGRRKETDAKKQPRGNHPGLPFMYIGKVGEGRRYECPLYKCNEQGPMVAEAVTDEEVRLPAEPLADLKSAERKRVLEMLVFQSFASASGLPIDEGSAENRDPDYPDILCTISGQRYWFELGQIIHEDVAEKVNPKRRNLDGGFTYDQEQPFVDLVTSKSSKKYTTEGVPVDLILHFDLRFGSASAVKRLCEKHTALLEKLTTRGPFKRVWVFDDFKKIVIWPLPC
jgi:hypothetical protein